jgi:hypothetical protein
MSLLYFEVNWDKTVFVNSFSFRTRCFQLVINKKFNFYSSPWKFMFLMSRIHLIKILHTRMHRYATFWDVDYCRAKRDRRTDRHLRIRLRKITITSPDMMHPKYCVYWFCYVATSIKSKGTYYWKFPKFIACVVATFQRQDSFEVAVCDFDSWRHWNLVGIHPYSVCVLHPKERIKQHSVITLCCLGVQLSGGCNCALSLLVFILNWHYRGSTIPVHERGLGNWSLALYVIWF